MGRFKNNISFVKHEHKGKEAYVLYLKSEKKVSSIDDISVLGFITTDPIGGKFDSVYQSVSVPGMGNILYAMVAMSVTERGRMLCCNQDGDLREEADDLWHRIRNNKHFSSEWLPIELIHEDYITCNRECEYESEFNDMTNAEYFAKIMNDDGDIPNNILYAAYSCEPDYGYSLTRANHEKSSMSADVLSEVVEVADAMFWTAFNDDVEYNVVNDLERTGLAQDNYSKLSSFISGKSNSLSA
nr:hypothetical protein [Vibrio splendidus]MCC4882758.1 hypothetical protein [Vibrio splendidus]